MQFIAVAALQKVLDHHLVMVLRDQDTIEELKVRLKHARRVILVGNGGIAMELAYSLQGIEVLWLQSMNFNPRI